MFAVNFLIDIWLHFSECEDLGVKDNIAESIDFTLLMQC